MKNCEICYRWLTCFFSTEIHFTCLDFFRQVIYIIYIILLPLVQTSVPKSFQQSISQGNYRTEQTFIRRGLQGMQKITEHKELFSTFLEFLFSHCCYMEKYWYSNNHIQRVYIFIVRKSGKTDFKCILKAGYFKKR